MTVSLRHSTPADLNFVFNSWLKSFRSNEWVRTMKSDAYYRLHHNAIEAALARGVVVVATMPDDPNHILGFVAGERRSDETIVNYVYVKQPYRNMGVAAQLISTMEPVAFYTHLTRRRAHKSLANAAYVPHLFFA